MKGILITFTLCLFHSLLFCQTSEEEYLYVTYGYKEQLLKGLDDKKGYYWKPITEYKFTDESGTLVWKKSMVSKFEFEGLYRDDETAPCAIVAIYKSNETMKKKDSVFIPIPHADSSQETIAKAKKYLEEDINFAKSTLSFYSLALGKLAMVLAQ